MVLLTIDLVLIAKYAVNMAKKLISTPILPRSTSNSHPLGLENLSVKEQSTRLIRVNGSLTDI